MHDLVAESIETTFFSFQHSFHDQRLTGILPNELTCVLWFHWGELCLETHVAVLYSWRSSCGQLISILGNGPLNFVHG